MNAPHPLDLLVGQWNTRGHSVGGSADQSLEIKGTDKYEWLPGRRFVVHYVDVWMGEEKVNVVELIGPCGETADKLDMHSFSNDGRHEVMQAVQQSPRAWTFESDDTRANLTIELDGRSMTALWERKTEDGTWTAWLEMQFARAT